MLNERDAIRPLLTSLLEQTSPPSEIIITDAGSTDGTWEVLTELTQEVPALHAFRVPGDRSTGRNAAIRSASNATIACIDVGCVAQPDWLERLTGPIENGARWVAGFYLPKGGTTRSTSIGLVMVYVLDEVDPETFLPSTRSMAFLKSAWEEVGGFPEGLAFAEDTLFDERLLAAGYRPVFAGDAVVLWDPPDGYRSLAKTLFRWGRGDGIAGLRGVAYRRLALVFGGTLFLALTAVALEVRALPLALVPLAISTVHRTRHKYRWADGATKWLHIPLAHLVHSAAGLIGFVVGRTGTWFDPDGTARWGITDP